MMKEEGRRSQIWQGSVLIKGHRKARLHSEGNEKLLKDSKTRGMESTCVREFILHF